MGASIAHIECNTLHNPQIVIDSFSAHFQLADFNGDYTNHYQEEDFQEEDNGNEKETSSLDVEVAAAAETTAEAEAKPQIDHTQLLQGLFAEHSRRLFRFVVKHIGHQDDAADIVQQTFAEAARTIGNFRGDSQLSTWLYGIAMNMVRNYLSRAPHRVHKFESEDILNSFVSPMLDPSDSSAQKESVKQVTMAMAALPKEMREILTIIAINEISYEETADILCIPLGTVRSRVSRARALLRKRLEKAGVTLDL